MHVLYIHQYFSTRDGAAGTRSYEFARALLAKGHTVTMVCGSSGRAVTGLEGPFRSGRRSGSVDGMNVVEFEVAYTNHDSISARARKFITFAIRSTMLALWVEYDLLFATSTPLTAAIPGVAARLLGRKPFVFEVRDLWPELPRAMGMRNPFALGGMYIIEWLGYRTATRMVALAPGIAEGIARLGVPRNHIDIIPNGCDFEVFEKVLPLSLQTFLSQQFAPGKFVAVFAGAHGIANGLDAVLNAAGALKRRGRSDIMLFLVGEGTCKSALMERARVEGLDNVIFHDPIPKHQLVRLLKGADLGMQILADVPAFYQGTSPNKFFDYLAAGMPVLINYPGWLAELVEREACGFVVPPHDPEAFAGALIHAADDRLALKRMAEQAITLGRREFEREQLALRFVEALEYALLQHLSGEKGE